MDMACLGWKMVLYMKANGKMISRTDKDVRDGAMDLNIEDSSRMV